MNTNENPIRKGQTVTVNYNGKTGKVAGIMRTGALLIKFEDGTQAREWPSGVTPA